MPGVVPGLEEAFTLAEQLSPLSAIGGSLPPASVLEPHGVESPEPAPTEGDASLSDLPAASQEADLSEEEQQQVEELAKRDLEVRQHEQAHLAAAGGHARGGPSYE